MRLIPTSIYQFVLNSHTVFRMCTNNTIKYQCMSNGVLGSYIYQHLKINIDLAVTNKRIILYSWKLCSSLVLNKHGTRYSEQLNSFAVLRNTPQSILEGYIYSLIEKYQHRNMIFWKVILICMANKHITCHSGKCIYCDNRYVTVSCYDTNKKCRKKMPWCRWMVENYYH